MVCLLCSIMNKWKSIAQLWRRFFSLKIWIPTFWTYSNNLSHWECKLYFTLGNNKWKCRIRIFFSCSTTCLTVDIRLHIYHNNIWRTVAQWEDWLFVSFIKMFIVLIPNSGKKPCTLFLLWWSWSLYVYFLPIYWSNVIKI